MDSKGYLFGVLKKKKEKPVVDESGVSSPASSYPSQNFNFQFKLTKPTTNNLNSINNNQIKISNQMKEKEDDVQVVEPIYQSFIPCEYNKLNYHQEISETKQGNDSNAPKFNDNTNKYPSMKTKFQQEFQITNRSEETQRINSETIFHSKNTSINYPIQMNQPIQNNLIPPVRKEGIQFGSTPNERDSFNKSNDRFYSPMYNNNSKTNDCTINNNFTINNNNKINNNSQITINNNYYARNINQFEQDFEGNSSKLSKNNCMPLAPELYTNALFVNTSKPQFYPENEERNELYKMKIDFLLNKPSEF